MTVEATEKKILNVPFELKEEDIDESGVFKGYGAAFGNKDSHSDIIMPGAFTKTILKNGRNGTGVAMLYQHDSRRPIGIWNMLAEDKKGLKVEGKLILGTQDGRETYELMKAGALKGLSIGYDSVVDELDRDKRVRYLKEVALWEISPVTFGSNLRAQVISVKEIKELIQQSTTERELETALRDSDVFSKSDAQHVISLIKAVLRDSGATPAKDKQLSEILDSLKEVNQNIENKNVAGILGKLQEISL